MNHLIQWITHYTEKYSFVTNKCSQNRVCVCDVCMLVWKVACPWVKLVGGEDQTCWD